MAESIAPTRAQWRAYLSTFCGASTLVVGGVASLNYVVDPYLIHQWDSPQVQTLRPSREKLSAWGKTYAVARMRPAVLYLGNSRTELGLPTKSGHFGVMSVFNAALSGASAGDVMAMARHAIKVRAPDTVVWGLDAPSFSLLAGNTDFDRALVSDGVTYFVRRGLLDVKRGLTVDMTRDSIRVLRGTFGAECLSSLALNGQRDDACVANRIEGLGGTSAVITPRLQEYARGDGPTAQALDAFVDTLGQLCESGTRVRLYVNPTHALMLDALHWAGKWDAFERWQRGLAIVAALRRAAGCDVKLYDFSGFNSVTTEPIPQVSRQGAMTYYWETSHYRVNVGHMMLDRMFGAGHGVPADFGVELAPSMMDGHLAGLRAQRERYHAEHAAETAFVRRLVEPQLAARTSP